MGLFDNPLPGIVTDISSIAKNVLGGLGIGGASSTTHSDPNLPWSLGPGVSNSRFFDKIDIKTDRWDQLFPYRLLVVETSKGNPYVVGSSSGSVDLNIVGGKGESSIITFKPVDNTWIFQLPITPQQLNITDQFAIQTTPTLRGILEEHSGVRFKNIAASGTMGVWPYRESVTKPPASPGLIQSFLGGTVQGVTNLASSIGNVVRTITSVHPASSPVTTQPDQSTAGATSTGYYQAMALQQFLEQYAEAKKLPQNAGWRLIFDIPKQNQSFVVTPMQFVWQQSVNKPLEISYSFQLKAWRRINLTYSAAATQLQFKTLTPGLLQTALNTIRATRQVMSASTDLIGSVRSDVSNVLDVFRQTGLLIKDLHGVGQTAADFPDTLQRDWASAMTEAILNTLDPSDPKYAEVSDKLKSIQSSAKSREGLSMSAVANGQLGAQAATSQSIDPSNNILNNPSKNFDIIDLISVNSLSLSNAQQRAVDLEMEKIRNITIEDIRNFRATILELTLQLSNSFGSGDAVFSEIYNRPAPKVRLSPMSIDEYAILNSLYDAIKVYDMLTATTQLDNNKIQSSLDFVAGLANQSGIPFHPTKSKIMAPVPFGLTMPEISARYLGDPLRWLEIAALNDLREPYIDEDGFTLPLLSNGLGRQITVSSSENLFVGQVVTINSNSLSVQWTARKIQEIEQISNFVFLITLDGDTDATDGDPLDVFLTSDSSYLKAYLPGTVNSQQKIWIPSDLRSPESSNVTPPALALNDPYTAISGVDLLLTDSGDLAVDSFGEARLSFGLTNLIQDLKIAIGTVKGKWLLHPDFGLNSKVGMMTSDLDLKQIYKDFNDLIKRDPRYSGIQSLQLELNGPTLTINLAASIVGQSGVFPVTFQIST